MKKIILFVLAIVTLQPATLFAQYKATFTVGVNSSFNSDYLQPGNLAYTSNWHVLNTVKYIV